MTSPADICTPDDAYADCERIVRGKMIEQTGLNYHRADASRTIADAIAARRREVASTLTSAAAPNRKECDQNSDVRSREVARPSSGDMTPPGASSEVPGDADKDQRIADLKALIKSAELTIAHAMDRELQANTCAEQAEAREARLVEALRPFAAYADVALTDGMDGFFGEIYSGGFRHSIKTIDLRRARAAFAQHAKPGTEGGT